MVEATQQTTGTVPPPAAAASGFGERVSEGIKNSKTKEGVDKIAASGKPLSEGLQAMGTRIREMLLGGADRTKGAVGGIVGGTLKVTDSVTGKATGMIGSVASRAGNFAKNNPTIAIVGAAVAAYAVIKGFFNRRDKKAELDETVKRNELAATQLANASMQSSMPEFNNEAARADFVKKYGTRDQSQSNARA